MNLSYVKIQYFGAEIEIAEFLLHLWPDELALKDWPTFCGAGSGPGDWFVSDYICGVYVSPCCFQHDIDFSALDSTWGNFFNANMRLYLNLRAFVYANVDRKRYSNRRIEASCLKYFSGVMLFGWKHFKKKIDPQGAPLEDKTVKEKLHRLASATLGLQ